MRKTIKKKPERKCIICDSPLHDNYNCPYETTKIKTKDLEQDVNGMVFRKKKSTKKVEMVDHPAHYGGVDNHMGLLKLLKRGG